VSQLLSIYLNDHLAAASAGVELARRAAASHDGFTAAPTLHDLAEELAADRDALLELMGSIDVPVRTYKVYLGWAAEKIGRLKLNGRIVRRSPLSTLVELEGLAVAVHAKMAGWRTLRAVADSDDRVDARRLDGLIARAHRQADTVEQLRVSAAATLFGDGS